MRDLMIDLESMGTGRNAAIVAVGAVFFDEHTGQIGDKFYRAVHLATSVRLGFEMEPGTVLWWLGQPDAIRNAILFNSVAVEDAMEDFVEWVKARSVKDELKVWGSSPAFDCIKLEAHITACGFEKPWHFWNERDYRTIRERNRIVEQDEREGLHNAAEDAMFQALHLIKIRKHHAAQRQATSVG